MQKEQYIKNILSEKKQIYFNIDQYEGNLYHQLKTPVTSLQLCLEQLQEMIPEDLWKTANLQLLLRPDSGKVLYDDVLIHDLSAKEQERLRRQQIGFVFQDYQLLPELTVKENIILPQILDDREIDYDWCDQILETLEMTPHADKYPFELSGGQQQRTAIGRTIINRPRFLFTDEPTGNLDKQTSESVLNLFLKIHQMYDPMILVVTHVLELQVYLFV